jgi:Arc/MetJ-type ribon-helix-helix transcriptional regulator
MSKEKSKDQFENVPISKAIVEKIKKRIEQTDFDSVSSYITYVLEEVLSEEDDEEEAVFSKEDEERVKERLKALGYLD